MKLVPFNSVQNRSIVLIKNILFVQKQNDMMYQIKFKNSDTIWTRDSMFAINKWDSENCELVELIATNIPAYANEKELKDLIKE